MLGYKKINNNNLKEQDNLGQIYVKNIAYGVNTTSDTTSLNICGNGSAYGNRSLHLYDDVIIENNLIVNGIIANLSLSGHISNLYSLPTYNDIFTLSGNIYNINRGRYPAVVAWR